MRKYYYLIIFLLVALDQFTKYVFYDLRFMEDNYFITPLTNDGISWGIEIFPMDILVLVTITIIGFVIWMYRKKYIGNTEFILIISGACGNLIDRFWLQGVRDFADVHFWPVFNMADAYISIGFIFLIYYTYFTMEKEETKKNHKK